jgi:hypothetical protein
MGLRERAVRSYHTIFNRPDILAKVREPLFEIMKHGGIFKKSEMNQIVIY